jgi:hypothetical protein
MKAVSLVLLSRRTQNTGDMSEGARHNRLTATEQNQEITRYSQRASATDVTTSA